MFSRELHCRLENGKITDVFFTQVSTLNDFSCRCPFFHLTHANPREFKINKARPFSMFCWFKKGIISKYRSSLLP
jgi:hypothetical protein